MDDIKKTKMTFRQWIENIWYHYKAPIIIGFFAMIILVVCIVQFASKHDPDVFIYYVGQGGITAQRQEELVSDMSGIAGDYNNDGETTVDYKEDIFVMYSVDNETEFNTYVYNSTDQMNIVKRFNMELGMGDCVVYIMEPNLYKSNKDYILPLEDAVGYAPSFAMDDKGIKISDLQAYGKTALSNFPENYIICVRNRRSNDDKEYFDGNLDFFKKLVEYK